MVCNTIYSQNALFVLSSWRFSISCVPGVRQSEVRHIIRQCMLMLSKYWEHIYYIYLFTVYYCFISLNLLAKNIKCTLQLYSWLLSKFYNLWLILTCTVYRNSSGLVLQVVVLERYVLESKQFSFWPFQFSISTVFKCPILSQDIATC